jgi:hypothetical protein
MSISYQSSDPVVQGQALKWQTLVLRELDTQIVTDFATATPDIDVQQNVDNVAGSSRPVCYVIRATGGGVDAAISVAVSGSTITPTFGSAVLTGDSIVVHYVISE